MLGSSWAKTLLRALGDPVTQRNLNFLKTWQRWEGGGTANSADWNPLNTTSGQGRSINSVGVKAFGSPAAGIAATVATLRNGRYPAILAGLAQGNPYAAQGVAGDLQTWVSGKRGGNPVYAQHVLGDASGRVAPTHQQQRVAHAVKTAPPEVVKLAYQILQRNGITLPPLQAFLPPPRQGVALPHESPQTVAFPAAGSARLLAPAKGPIIGRPYQGTHRLYGNWESDNAVDIKLPVGTPIRAVANGVIGQQFGALGSSDSNLEGLRLHLVSGGNEFYYAHLSSFAPGIHPGAHVKAGQIIGYSGQANGVGHLHFASEKGHPLGIK